MAAQMLPKKTRKAETEATMRSWVAKPVLTPEFTEDPPLHEVYVGILKDKKNISTAIQSITAILPGFGHLKRCSTNRLLLAPLKRAKETKDEPNNTDAHGYDVLTREELKSLLLAKGFDVSLLEDDFQMVQVPSRAPKTKAQAQNSSKIWPVNFHPDPNVEAVLSGSIFDENQLNSIERYMKIAIEAARREAIADGDCYGSAVVVNPEDGRVLAVAASRTDRHPMWHASMVIVDLIAKLQGGGAWNLEEKAQEEEAAVERKTKDNEEVDDTRTVEDPKSVKRKCQENIPLCFPTSLKEINLPDSEPLETRSKSRGQKNGNGGDANPRKHACDEHAKFGPYLCTGYWVFLLKEPCALCAMALLHSRVAKIFYGIASDSSGVLGSRATLHSVPGLNHRYQVWRGILERECLAVSKEIIYRDSSRTGTGFAGVLAHSGT